MEIRVEAGRPDDGPAIPARLEAAGLADQVAAAVVAWSGIHLIGVAALEIYGNAALLRSVAGREGWRGVGTALVTAALDLGRRGVKEFYLLTETAPAFFARFGFRAIPRSAGCMPRDRNRDDLVRVDPRRLKLDVARHYSQVARSVGARPAGCCGPAPDTVGCCGVTRDTAGVPAEAVAAFRGCGNPVGLATLRSGEVVLDLGPGGGLDVIVAAREVGPTGAVYGLDLSPGMARLARQNAARAGVENAAFIRGDLEAIPLRPGSVDAVISNCVLNLTADKAQAILEAFRVLRPGGRLIVADIVVDPNLAGLPLDERTVRAALSWAGCLAGALTAGDYRALLEAAGFADIHIRVDFRFSPAGLAADLPAVLRRLDPPVLADLAARFASATITAYKPG